MSKSQVLCSTSTLALGVNLPAHLVVVKSTRRWSAYTEVAGYKEYDTATCLQMIGRCVPLPQCSLHVQMATVAQSAWWLCTGAMPDDGEHAVSAVGAGLSTEYPVHAGRVVRNSTLKGWRSS